MDGPDTRAARAGHQFPATRWSLIDLARDDAAASAPQAIEEICRLYWYPLYAYARRAGNSAPEAEDLVQEFLTRLVTRRWLRRVAREKGKLRSFLLVAFKRLMANQHARSRARKRGGGAVMIPIDQEWAEERLHHEPANPLTPEDYYDRAWALSVLESALDTLRDEYRRADKGALYDRLKDVLLGNPDHERYAALGTELAMSEGAVKITIYRMRQRFRQLLHQHIAATVSSSDDVNEELQHLISLFGK